MIKRIISPQICHISRLNYSFLISKKLPSPIRSLRQISLLASQFSTKKKKRDIKSSPQESPSSILKLASVKYEQIEIQEIREGITLLMRKKIVPKHLEDLEVLLLKMLTFAQNQYSRQLQRTYEVEKFLFLLQTEIKEFYPHFRFLHIFALLKVLEVCPINSKTFTNKLYLQIFKGNFTFSFDQLSFLSSTEYIKNNQQSKNILGKVCLGLLKRIPTENLPKLIGLQALIKIGLIVEESKEVNSQFWALYENLIGLTGSQFEGLLKKQDGIDLIELLSRNRIIQREIWSFTISQILRYEQGSRITLKDLGKICEAIRFSNMKSKPISAQLRSYMLTQTYELQDFYKFLNYKEVVSIITGLYTLELNGEADNMDRMFNSYIQQNLEELSILLVDKLAKIKDNRLDERVREKIAQEFKKLERDINNLKDIEDTIEDEKERRLIMKRELHKQEHGRNAKID